MVKWTCGPLEVLYCYKFSAGKHMSGSSTWCCGEGTMWFTYSDCRRYCRSTHSLRKFCKWNKASYGSYYRNYQRTIMQVLRLKANYLRKFKMNGEELLKAYSLIHGILFCNVLCHHGYWREWGTIPYLQLSCCKAICIGINKLVKGYTVMYLLFDRRRTEGPLERKKADINIRARLLWGCNFLRSTIERNKGLQKGRRTIFKNGKSDRWHGIFAKPDYMKCIKEEPTEGEIKLYFLSGLIW